MVELRGIEPLSENASSRVSTGVAGDHDSPPRVLAGRGTVRVASSFPAGLKALPGPVHLMLAPLHPYEVSGERRRLRPLLTVYCQLKFKFAAFKVARRHRPLPGILHPRRKPCTAPYIYYYRRAGLLCQ